MTPDRTPLAEVPRGNMAAPTAADVDGDGDLDLIVGESSGDLNLLRNDGTPSQPEPWIAQSEALIERNGSGARPTLHRDADGLLLLVVGTRGGTLIGYRQKATGSSDFAPYELNLPNKPMPADLAPTLFDVDGDGIGDLTLGHQAGGLWSLSGRPVSALELKVPPVVVWLACAAGAWVLADALPSWYAVLPFRWVLVGVLAAAGAAFGVAGVVAFTQAQTTVNPHRPDRSSALVTSGIYGVTRNPMYVGLALGLLAWTAWLGHPAGLIATGTFVAYIDRFQIRPEQRAMQAQFGSAFARYSRRVRRWI